MNTIYTIGHSNQPWEDFVDLLIKHEIQLLVDVRSHPGSKKNPQFNKENFEKELGKAYLWMPALGGPMDGEYSDPNVFPKHRIGKDRDVSGIEGPTWTNQGLFDYDVWMGTDPNFMGGIRVLDDIAGRFKCAIMCCESMWWKCHRSMIGDVWVALGGDAMHIMSGKPKSHRAAIGNRLKRYTDNTKRLWLKI